MVIGVAWQWYNRLAWNTLRRNTVRPRMGMVRQWQDMHHEGRRAHSYSEASPDFVRLAKAYGWTGLRIAHADELEAAIASMIATPGPVLVDCQVADVENCYPMVPAGAAHDQVVLGP